jgi:hypothetical protein
MKILTIFTALLLTLAIPSTGSTSVLSITSTTYVPELEMIPEAVAKALEPEAQAIGMDATHEMDEIFVSKGIQNYIKNKNAVKLAKSNKVPYGIWYDPVKWNITKNYNNDAEFSFGLIGKDAYAFMIAESIKAPKDIVTNFVIDNIMKGSEDVEIIKIEDRIVNGLLVTYLRIDATIFGVRINYMIYLFCGEHEIIQIFAYSYGSFFPDLEDFLNGLSKAK